MDDVLTECDEDVVPVCRECKREILSPWELAEKCGTGRTYHIDCIEWDGPPAGVVVIHE